MKNRVEGDDRFPNAALQDLSPSRVFKCKNTLQRTKVDKMIRLYISLRERTGVGTPAQSIVTPSLRRTKSQDNQVVTFKGSLCVRGLFGPFVEKTNISKLWPFLSVGLIQQLQLIANLAWWDGRLHVEHDFERRNNNERVVGGLKLVLLKESAVDTALNTLNLFSSNAAEVIGE